MDWILIILVAGTLQIDGGYETASFSNQYKCAEAERNIQNRNPNANAVCYNKSSRKMFDHYPFRGLTREEQIARWEADIYLRLNRPR